MIIVLVYIEKLSLKEVGEIMIIPLPAVKTRIRRSREILLKQTKLYLN
ncbi:hypothetical protein DV702_08465 [Sporosarcina sp. PTS2304]|nr:hypothetical protein DV702_08465 [Sporosarcina sp. PTS2304]